MDEHKSSLIESNDTDFKRVAAAPKCGFADWGIMRGIFSPWLRSCSSFALRATTDFVGAGGGQVGCVCSYESSSLLALVSHRLGLSKISIGKRSRPRILLPNE
jgi:hypothetical protein